ncbi:hypothetical protein [Elizabethkingia miricola]|uniref:hypothetical protein n=1 Tax=Elizabethkingia miricola TaxID=172045 RepID=UPI000B35EE00|nr:hypothetical protein [Elizabethkingia miricola]NHQ67197.1 hypothetical protein [Elizabethkingia miricola]NHQ70542.1 hypothetical protein [Elizabethkingia miricola]NHQ76523.1 hypothetical protein [Elizabethkingia miricola]UIO96340.1 hypothetical protein LYZ41_19330 [Elizabethkingia miricola]WER13126.1 hypothetical protein P0M31_19075 [Elizabethkingia miricola]
MEEVVYSLNGIEFNTKNNPYKIFVSKSDGLMAKLKPKAKTTYEWPNQHGKQSNPLQKVRYESREISLECWVEGSGWKEMKDNYDALMSEFDKLGTQRLIISPFGTTTPLIYDVALVESSDPKQAFNKGEMVGVFTLKMTEERPVKKVLYTASTNLQLSFNSPSQVIINIDGKAQQAKGDVSINTNLPKRVVSGGIKNLLLESNVQFSVPPGTYRIGGYMTSKLLEVGKTYTLMYKSGNGSRGSVRAFVNGYQAITDNDIDGGIKTSTFTQINIPVSANSIDFYSMPDTDKWGSIHWAVLVEGESMPFQSWVPNPEDQHYISIAGNIDEITNLNTNAQILWEKL